MKNHVDINSDVDIGIIMDLTNLKFNTQNEMSFDDLVYLTDWRFDNKGLQSETNFLSLKTESFTIDSNFIYGAEILNEYFPQYQTTTLSPTSFKSPLHRNSHLELYFVESGTFEVYISNELITLTKGDCLLMDRHTIHADIFNFQDACVKIIGIDEAVFTDNILLQVTNKDFIKFLLNSKNTRYTGSEHWIIKQEDIKPTLQIIDKLREELVSKSVGSIDVIRIYLLRFIELLTSSDQLKVYEYTAESVRSIVFKEIEDIILNNYKDVTLGLLEQYMMFSKDYFNRIIKEFTGLTYTQYVQTVRINKAKRMLVSTGKSVNEIANDVGYSNIKHFYDIFKQQTSQTPQEYKNTILEETSF